MKFTLYWLDGKREVVEGDTIVIAFRNAGYGGNSISALDFHAKGDNKEYKWNDHNKNWELKY